MCQQQFGADRDSEVGYKAKLCSDLRTSFKGLVINSNLLMILSTRLGHDKGMHLEEELKQDKVNYAVSERDDRLY